MDAVLKMSMRDLKSNRKRKRSVSVSENNTAVVVIWTSKKYKITI